MSKEVRELLKQAAALIKDKNNEENWTKIAKISVSILRLDPANINGCLLYASASQHMKKYDQAIGALRKVISIDESLPAPWKVFFFCFRYCASSLPSLHTSQHFDTIRLKFPHKRL